MYYAQQTIIVIRVVNLIFFKTGDEQRGDVAEVVTLA